MAQQFVVGDRVIVIDERATGVLRGTLGTVVRVFARVPEICDVQFDTERMIRAVLTSGLVLAPPADPPPHLSD